MENNISYCNFDCTNCSVYMATISENIEEKKKIAEKYNIDLSEVNCLGCKSNMINKMCRDCSIRKEKMMSGLEDTLALVSKAFKENKVLELLTGIDGYVVPTDRKGPAHLPTDFGRVIKFGIYPLYKKNIQENLVVIFKETLIELLKGTPYQVWCAYSFCWEQQYNESKGEAPFSIITEEFRQIVKESLLKNKDKLIQEKVWQAQNYKEGLWEDIKISDNVLRKYGKSFLDE